MKKIFIIAMLATFAISCSPTPQQIAEKNAKEYVKTKSLNPESYKAISFGQIDTVWTTLEEHPIYKGFYDANDNFKYYRVMENIGGMEQQLNIMEQIKPSLDSLMENFKPEIKHLTIGHSYKVKNEYGIEIQPCVTVILDPVTLEAKDMDIDLKSTINNLK